jgi:hypothetical protein
MFDHAVASAPEDCGVTPSEYHADLSRNGARRFSADAAFTGIVVAGEVVELVLPNSIGYRAGSIVSQHSS